MNFPIFSIKKIKKNIYFFSKNVKLGRLEGLIFLSMCAKYLVQSPSISSKNALVCAMDCPWGAKACLGVCHGKPMGCQGLPWHALVCAMASPWGAKACHGMPWCVAWQAMSCHDMPWCVPRHALVCAMASHGLPMACLGVCHDKSCACQINFCPCKPPKLCF